MIGKLDLKFNSSLEDICEKNSSFDSGVLKIAYTGENRNGSSISKESFEKCLNTIYNCPIVCNYDRDNDTLGGHDIDVVKDTNGNPEIINITTPVGCIPESAKVYWETVNEDDGSKHEYLCAEALLWKRQEAYQKIKKDGCSALSMEINVKDGFDLDNGTFAITDFEFTAFALIGVEPCFESASLTFSLSDFKEEFEQMCLELKDFKLHEKGGNKNMNTGEIVVDNIDNTNTSQKEIENNFELVSNLSHELDSAFRETNCYVVDFDSTTNEVFFMDCRDGCLYGAPFACNGDKVDVDTKKKKRKKFTIVDYVDGDNYATTEKVFEFVNRYSDEKKICEDLSAENENIKKELDELNAFKLAVETEELNNKRNEVFDKFADLCDINEFNSLKENVDSYSIEELEEKCYAIRGKHKVKFSFDASKKTPKLKIDNGVEKDTEPYGGLFQKYNK